MHGVCGVQEQPHTLILTSVGFHFTLSDGAKKGLPSHLNLRGKIPLGEASTESCSFSHFGPFFVHAKHIIKHHFPLPATKLSGLFGEIQQKLFLWEFHLLELHLTGQRSLLRDVSTFPVQGIHQCPSGGDLYRWVLLSSFSFLSWEGAYSTTLG